jgi:hypothetical protein
MLETAENDDKPGVRATSRNRYRRWWCCGTGTCHGLGNTLARRKSGSRSSTKARASLEAAIYIPWRRAASVSTSKLLELEQSRDAVLEDENPDRAAGTIQQLAKLCGVGVATLLVREAFEREFANGKRWFPMRRRAAT